MEATCFHFRRRIAVKKLMGRWSFRRTLVRGGSGGARPTSGSTERERLLGHTLKDLFVSSPPPPALDEKGPARPPEGGGRELVGRAGVAGGPRIRAFGFRHRFLLRRAWRPGLGAIPE